MKHYILNERGEPVEASRQESMEWLDGAVRTVASEEIGDALVSTVFLWIDHAFGDGPPVLWETMVFGGDLDQEQDRCSGSREQALAMHAEMVSRVKALKRITP